MMELEIVPSAEPPPLDPLGQEELLPEQVSDETNIPMRKRQRLNLQDVSNTKPLAPVRASGRIRIKMSAAAELKTPEPTVKVVKTVLNHNSSSINHKQRRRPKKLKTDLVSELAIDVKRPSSVLVDTSIRALLTNVAFAQLSPENQKILIESLPLVDRPVALSKENQGVELNPSSINNEFFNRACLEWRDRLSNGEFTNESQMKLRAEQERERSKIDPWKARNFEGIWGIKSNGNGSVNVGAMMEKSALEMKGRVKQGDFEIPEGFISEVWEREQCDDEETSETLKEESWDNEVNSNEPDVIAISPSPDPYSSAQMESTSDCIENQVISLDSDEPLSEEPVIAEATSSADDTHLMNDECLSPTTLSNFNGDGYYTDNIGSQVEISYDEISKKCYQQEHDYLKNEHEVVDMKDSDDAFENETDCDIDNDVTESFVESSENDDFCGASNIVKEMSQVVESDSRISTYDTELPQEIFHMPEDTTPYKTDSSSVIINNYAHNHADHSPFVIRQQMSGSPPVRLNSAVTLQEDHVEPVVTQHEMQIERTNLKEARTYRDDVHMSIAKNVKLLAFPPGVKYNEKFIIEEPPHQQQQSIHQGTSSFRPNGTSSIQSIPHSYFVGGTNFAYISKLGNKVEATEATRIVKQDTSTNQNQVKQRIIYEIATEPNVSYEQPSSHHVTYTSQPQQEIFHQMVKHPNGTTTIFETTAPQTKKTIIQRKKTIDPYTVQVVANNNTIILTPIGSTSQQSLQQQHQKSIVHIHRTQPLMQTGSSPVQYLAAPQTVLKKQTVIHPQMIQKSQTKYTTVIRAPSVPPPQIIATVSSKIQRPIQKQKVIMSTSSLQQYRSSSQKPSNPSGHGSRKQLHPQHIIRPAPTSTATVIQQHQMTQEQNVNQIPVILPSARNDHMIMSSSMPLNTTHIPAVQPTVLTIGPPGINNIYVRPKRPQQIFHSAHHHLNTMNNLMNSNNITLGNQQMLIGPPRMRNQQNLQRPPPGTVNLERSYQICQAVIQSSANPNRDKLNNQLKKF